MKIEIIFSEMDSLKYKEFLRTQVRGHREEDCEFPGTTLEIISHPALGGEVLLHVGSVLCEFDDVQVKYFDF